MRDGVVIDGRVVKMPRYYDKLMEKLDPVKLGRVKLERAVAAHEFKSDRTPDRMRVREEVSRRRLSRFSRNLGE